jgi:hypothetical protein
MTPRFLVLCSAVCLAVLAFAAPAEPAAAGLTNNLVVKPTSSGKNTGANQSLRTADKGSRFERDWAADGSCVNRFGFGRASDDHNHLYLDKWIGSNLSVPAVGLADYIDFSCFSLPGDWPSFAVVNQPPVASTAGTSPTVSTNGAIAGAAPFTVNFVGSNSSDPDGIVVSYLWDFGDGTTSTLANVSKTYQGAGDFNVKLTVTDVSGATAAATLRVSVGATTPPSTVKSLNVSAISMVYKRSNVGNYIAGKVTILDQDGNPVRYALVRVSTPDGFEFDGSYEYSTDSKGQVKLNVGARKGVRTYTFTVTNVVKGDYLYDPAKNTVTSASLTR